MQFQTGSVFRVLKEKARETTGTTTFLDFTRFCTVLLARKAIVDKINANRQRGERLPKERNNRFTTLFHCSQKGKMYQSTRPWKALKVAGLGERGRDRGLR